MIKISFLLLALLLLVSMAHTATARSTYTVGICSIDSPGSRIPEFEALLSEAYLRAGSHVQFKYLPMLRELEYANSGRTDGSWIRTLEAIENYPGLKAVPTPIVLDSVSAFSFDPNVKSISLNDLKGMELAVVRGDMSSTNLVKKYLANVHEVDCYEQLFSVLGRERVSVVVCNTTIGRELLARSDMHRVYSSDPLQVRQLFHVMNIACGEEMIKRVDGAFRDMFKDGAMKKLAGKYSYLLAYPKGQ